MKKHLGLLLMLMLAAPAADAQTNTLNNTEFGVSLDVPAGWEPTDSTDRAVFALRATEGQGQIEVIGTPLMTADVADVFFSTFHETLSGSDFVKAGAEDKTYASVAGKETIYQFSHTGTTIKIVVFQFVREETAWLVVGYLPEADFDRQVASVQAAIGALKFGP